MRSYEEYMAMADKAERMGETADARDLVRLAQVARAGSVDAYARQRVDAKMGERKSAPNPMSLNSSGNPRSFTEKMAIGAGKAFADVGAGVGQLTGMMSDEAIQQREERDAPIMESGAGQAGHLAGTIAAYLPTTLIPGANTVMGASAIGAGIGATQPVAEGESRLANTAFGGVGGAVGSKIGSALNPKTNPQVTKLMDEGITPTPGQALGGGFRKAEEYARSIPFVGSMIEGAERRTTEQFNKAAINRVLAPIGKKSQGIGRKGIEYARNEVSDAYNNALAKVKGDLGQDAKFFSEVSRVLKKASEELTDENFAKFAKFLEPRMVSKMSAESMKQLDSELGEEAIGYLSDASFDNRKLGALLRDVQSSLRSLVTRQAPDAAEELTKANKAFANLKRVERAASGLGAEEGVFNPAQLQNAVKALDRSKDKIKFTQGKALMQDLSEPAKSVLGNHQPDSGTAGRLLTAGMGLTNPLEPRNLYRGIIAAGSAAAYSPAGQSALVKALTQRGPVTREVGKRLSNSPYAPLAGSLLGVEYGQ